MERINPVRNDRFAEHNGIVLLSATDGSAVARMTVQPWHLNGVGIVQGGALFTLADVALAGAANAVEGVMSVSMASDIRYFKAESTGVLTATATAVSVRRTVATYRVDITNEAGEIIASLLGTVYRKYEETPNPTPFH